MKFPCKCGAVGVVSDDPFIEGRFMISWWRDKGMPSFERDLRAAKNHGCGHCTFTSRAKTMAQAILDRDIEPRKEKKT